MIEAFPTPLHITRPMLPGLREMNVMLEQIWDSGQLSNNGNMAKRLEKEMADYLGVNCLSLFANGTIALQTACRILNLTGEVITTPFTFAATVNSLALNNIRPVFCDIEEDTFNINPDKIEPLITEHTSAIMPVHVFGNPCKVEQIQKIADRYGLKVIYDAAHAFGVRVNGKPVASFGDISMFSLHATKIYHTVEGGALTFNSSIIKEKADYFRNFGLLDNGDVAEPGTNGKMNEVQAAVGLLLLGRLNEEIKRRMEITNLYKEMLKEIPGIETIRIQDGISYNYPYFIVRVDEKEYGISRDILYEKLLEYNVGSRKYFYPLCSNYLCYKNLPSASESKLPIANRVADSVLALPLHGRLIDSDIEKICKILSFLRKNVS